MKTILADNFGDYRISKYDDESNIQHVSLYYCANKIFDRGYDDPDEASNEYHLIKTIVKHTAEKIAEAHLNILAKRD